MVKGLTAAPASPFHLKEVQAPSGYMTDEKEHEFKTDPLTRRYEFSDAFVNKEFGARPLPPTGGGPARDLLLITGGLPLAGSSVSALMKRRGQRLG